MTSSKVLQEQVDLEALHYILNQFSEDVSNDCGKIITKVLKPLSVSMFCESKCQDVKVFASVKLLLTLYENLNLNYANCKSELPIGIIIESLKYVFECNNENCRLPENDVQLNILCIVSSMFKSGLLLNSSNSLEELIKFYDYSLTCIGSIGSETECKSDCLIFKLKIITSIYQSLTSITYKPLMAEFYEKLNSVNKFKECELFADLILHADDGVASQALLHLIPAYISYFKSGRIIKIIWKKISTCLICDIWNSRVLIILCHIFDLRCEKSLIFSEDKVDLFLLLLEDINYWKLVQLALKGRDQIKRKQGLYLFKKAVDILNEDGKIHFCGKDKNTFYWHVDYKDEFYKIYNDVILTLEFLEEQQIHLVKPIFNLIKTLTENILNSSKVNLSWVLVIYKKTLLHENLEVVKWGLINFLKLPEKFFLDEHVARETAEMLTGTLNNMSLYYNNGLTISKELRVFFDKITQLNTCKIFFCSFIKKICSEFWSAEALFFVSHPLSDIGKCSVWGKDEISEMIIFVLKAFKTHHKIIRTGVQNNLLKACMIFTDKENVPLRNITFLICIFFERSILKMGSGDWNSFVCWLRSSYSNQEAKDVLEKYITEKSREEPNYMALMFILFYYIYNVDFCDSDVESYSSNDNLFALKYFLKILLSYKGINKRLYCDKPKHDQDLLIICSVYKASLKNSVLEFIKPTLPFLKDVILYIQTQLSKISDLQDFNEWELYLRTFEYTIKTLVLFQFDMEFTKCLCKEIIDDLQSSLQSNLIMCSVGKFWRIKFLSIMLRLPILELKHSFLNSYILKTVNEPLKKENPSEKTRELLNLWGKINSEFLEEKWKIFEYLINSRLIIHGSVKAEESCWISNDDLVELCVEALDTGGYGVLCPVISVLKNILPVMESDLEVRTIIDSVWKLVLERKKTEEFKGLIKQFVEMVFQEALINKESVIEILLKYVDFIFSNPSLAVVNIFMKHIQQLNNISKSVPLFCHIIGKGLIFGQIEKRDERLTNKVCSHIEFLKILSIQEISDFNTSNEIRVKAIQKILQLDRKFPGHQTVARELIDTLLKSEEELNKNFTRYFGNSHIHRVKHRIMQALLLLEPLLNQNEDCAIKLSKQVFQFLLSENSQPSVRYMQEWLLVRMIFRHSEVYDRLHINNYYDCIESKKKGSCSLIAIIYHSCQLINSDEIEGKIASGISSILEFCFHRHFELRLYAQVAFMSLYEFAKKKKFIKVTHEHENVYGALSVYFEKELRKNKNLFKLMNNFYFKNFHPLKNYSLETIYEDLPRLTNVDSDEWISLKMFSHCGVDDKEINVPLKNSSFSLKSVIQNNWLPKSFESLVPTEFLDKKSENLLDNYQKKLIPIKPLTPGWNKDNRREITGRDGLIVVASLIDRIPNLGGLARTCEVFGASQYVINSLKHIDDKQFASLSVTAEKWITIKEVKIQNLIHYMSEMKRKGYSIIGAEQALHSQALNSVNFPKKTLLLLGNEKEGIPPNLLPFLDICVEIPQLGLIRSLNVHVSGALFIWEYAKQHHFS